MELKLRKGKRQTSYSLDSWIRIERMFAVGVGGAVTVSHTPQTISKGEELSTTFEGVSRLNDEFALNG